MSLFASSMVSPFKRVGGKARLHKWILGHLPPHETYVEVFGGSAPILLNKPRPQGDEIYNDLDGLWVNTVRMTRTRGRELAEAVELTPYSRSEFADARAALRRWQDGALQLDPLEMARLHLVIMRQSFSGTGRWWSIPKAEGQSQIRPWTRLPHALVQAMRRLQGVHVEHLDYADALKTYDSPRATFYLDPPYARVEKEYYAVNQQSGFDHLALRNAVENLQGSVAISYYRTDLIERLYEGWETVSCPVTVHMGDATKKETELLIVRFSDFAKCRSRRPQIQEFFDDDGNDLLGSPVVPANNQTSTSQSGLLGALERHEDARASSAAGICLGECEA